MLLGILTEGLMLSEMPARSIKLVQTTKCVTLQGVQHDLKRFSVPRVFNGTHTKQHDTWHFMLFFISAMKQQNAVKNSEMSFKNMLLLD
jgi:hypothetical protein